MTPLLLLAVSAFVCAVLLTLVVAAGLLAALVFHFAPALQGTVLALTTSDVACALRQMPIYPTWWHHRDRQPAEPIFVLLALHPLGETEYLSGFDPLHRPIFTPNKNVAMRFNLKDNLQIKTVVRKVEDDGQNPFLVVDWDARSREALRFYASRLCEHWYDLKPPYEIPQPRPSRSSRSALDLRVRARVRSAEWFAIPRAQKSQRTLLNR